MDSDRSAYASAEDASWSVSKEGKRREYLKSALRDFLKARAELAVFLKNEDLISEGVRLVLRAYAHIRAAIANRVCHKKGVPNLYDQHKIIAGTQLSIMTMLPLRTRETARLSRDEILSDCNVYLDVIKLNADFAIFIGLDILWQWQGLAPDGFERRPTLAESAKAQLVNYAGKRVNNDPKHVFPLFWCSMLWYTIEEILAFDKTLEKYGVPTRTIA